MEKVNRLLADITPAFYQQLASLVETGKWPDGRRLTQEQRESALQLVLLWQSRHNHDAQHLTIATDGHIVHKSKQQLKEELNTDRKRLIACLKADET